MLGNIRKLVVVAGCQRSGTTLVGQILGAHPNALLIDETDGLYEWFHAYAAKEPEAGSLLRHMIALARGKYRPQHQPIEVKPGGGLLISPGVTHLILKAPNLTYSYQEISRLEVPVSIVYPVRDPRSVVASMMKLAHIPMVDNQLALIERNGPLAAEFNDEIAMLEDESVASHIKKALIWRIKSCLYERFNDQGLATFLFRYEHLVADPAMVCKAMSGHAGLTFDRRMLAHETVYRGFAPGLTERSRPVDQRSVGEWAERLTSGQVDDILEVAGDTLKRLRFTMEVPEQQRRLLKPINSEVLRSPLVLTGRGGSGTRIISEIAERAGVFLGNRLNVSRDSIEWVDLIYEMGIDKTSSDRSQAPVPDGKWDNLLVSRARDILASGGWRDSQSWGWKLPESMIVIPELFAAFSDAKLIHLVRHPVDSSLRRTHMTSRTNNPIGRVVLHDAYRAIGRAADMIKTDQEHMHNAITWLYQVSQVSEFARASLGAENYLELRYEDLVTEPEATKNRLVRFIGVDPLTVPVPTINANRMRNYEITDPRIDEVWQLCKYTAIQCGYEPIS